MNPDLAILTVFVSMNGKNAGAPPPAVESPLKVWDGTAWVSTGVTVTE
jgi:hypothetical protein